MTRTAIMIALLAAALCYPAQAAPADACKQCSDHRKRCMANYPGPTCKVDYDICVKNCRKK
jgi:hypothetical protein